MDGILVVDKPKGPTSRDVVNQVSKILGTKKVGHYRNIGSNCHRCSCSNDWQRYQIDRDVTSIDQRVHRHRNVWHRNRYVGYGRYDYQRRTCHNNERRCKACFKRNGRNVRTGSSHLFCYQSKR